MLGWYAVRTEKNSFPVYFTRSWVKKKWKEQCEKTSLTPRPWKQNLTNESHWPCYIPQLQTHNTTRMIPVCSYSLLLLHIYGDAAIYIQLDVTQTTAEVMILISYINYKIRRKNVLQYEDDGTLCWMISLPRCLRFDNKLLHFVEFGNENAFG